MIRDRRAGRAACVMALLPWLAAAGDLTWTRPAAWKEAPAGSPMRRAQYKIAGPGGEAECVVYYFGAGQGGDAAANAERWAGQFTKPDGSPAAAKTTPVPGTAVKVLLVEAAGTFRAAAMGGPAPAPRPGSMLLGAIAEGPDANWFFKLTGPEATVRAERAAFLRMLQSIRKSD